MKPSNELCPFSKAIIGKWCHCPYAKLVDRCLGKMTCSRSDDLQETCFELDEAFKVNTRFILGIKGENDELTHANLMKIRCGGLLGMQSVLKIESDRPVNIRDVIDKTIKRYRSIAAFPYNKIVQDIKNFKPESKKINLRKYCNENIKHFYK